MTGMANNFYYFDLKMLTFWVDNNVFWDTQNAPYCTILIEKNFRASKHESESTPLQDITSRLVCNI